MMPEMRLVHSWNWRQKNSMGETVQEGVHSSVTETQMVSPTEDGWDADPHIPSDQKKKSKFLSYLKKV